MASRRCSTRSEAAAGTGMMSNGGQTTAATQHNTQDKTIQRQHTTPTTRTSHQSLAQATAARAEQPHGVAATTRTIAPSASSWQHETKVTRHTATSGTANASLVYRLERHAAEAQAERRRRSTSSNCPREETRNNCQKTKLLLRSHKRPVRRQCSLIITAVSSSLCKQSTCQMDMLLVIDAIQIPSNNSMLMAKACPPQ